MKISVVVVTYNSLAFIDRCLEPLLGIPDSEIQIIVWDNNSSDGTFQYIRDRYPKVELRGGADNRGFAAGNNAAFQYCEGEYVLLLNPDAFLKSFDQIRSLASILTENPDAAAAGPMLVNPDGSHQVGDAGWSHTLLNAVGHTLFLHRIIPGVKSIYLTRPGLLLRELVDVDWICGACLLVRRDIIARVGGLKEEIFMYGEDVEWCERMRGIDRRVLYVPSLQVVHLQGGTQKSDETALFVSHKWIAALAKHVKASSPRWHFVALKFALILGFLIRALLYFFSDLAHGRMSIHRTKAMCSYAVYSAGLD
ncbi:glycosyltransferase family 2 protein [Bradyrhizobium sp. CCGUVB1N3]|uniref:glycosyltransferase family 2 protein n=1 Tax=Bradyrhizobium sp. CCGUVB1N3 TaxID=2949629 RepID=UPI0020B1A516|nr:glycosyltransferase family 2 protein [Bradyrhizobium sp. CCGUVB1N3]MCP3472149.1 glycosyltransferase family 2 protein [Bradyrhizobium sp. CCGUVB1N3]